MDSDGRFPGAREFELENRRAGVTPPPRAEGDWLGPAIGGALTAMVAAPVAGFVYGAAISSPALTTNVVNAIAEMAAGDALGGATLGASASFVYRGIHAGHPAMEAALAGRAMPGNVNGIVDAMEHTLGGVSSRSSYTSWTHDFNVAKSIAGSQGAGGVILRLPTGAPPAGATWRWEGTINPWGESEVLLRGERAGCCVLKEPW